jgi:hypothetical protein
MDSRIPRHGGAFDVRAVGHFGSHGRREMVYSVHGPLPSLRGDAWKRESESRSLILQLWGGHSSVRALLPGEAWRAHGGEAGPWTRCVRPLGPDEERHTLAFWAVRAAPPGLADAVTRLAVATAQASAKAGVCTRQNEDRIWDRMQRWLQAWRLSPERPARPLGPPRGRGTHALLEQDRAGGRQGEGRPPGRK